MAENYYTILTNVGKAKIANAQVLGEKVVMTHLAIGDGNGMHYNPTENQTALRNEVWRGHIGSIDTDLENPNWIVLEATIPSNAGGFNVREVGVFDDEDNLIAIGKYPETYKPILTEGSAKDLYVRMIIEVTNAASVQLKIDPTIAMPSRKWVEEEIEKHVKTTASLTQRGHVQLSDDINSTSTTEAATPSAVKAVNEKVIAHLDNKMNPHSVTASQIGAIPVTEKGKANGVASLGSDGKVPASQLSVTQPPDATTSRKGIVQLNNSVTSTSTTQAATANAVKTVNDRFSERAVLLGGGSKTAGTDVIAMGYNSKVLSDESIALGYNSEANEKGVAIGRYARGKGISIGADAEAETDKSVAVGLKSKAIRGGIAIGYESEAGPSAAALSLSAKATGGESLALGSFCKALNWNEAVIGGRIWETVVEKDFRVRGSKNFEIPHPHPEKKATHTIRHGAVESPTPGDTLYRYFIDVKENVAHVRLCGDNAIIKCDIKKTEEGYKLVVPLPDYWVYLNKDPQVTVNGYMHFGTGTGYIDKEKESLVLLLQKPKAYHVILYGTRNDDNIQHWYIKGVERKIGESWLGETYVFEVDEITETEEMKEEIE